MQTRKRTPADVRFWAKVQKTGSCWLWTGSTNGRYGKFKVASYATPVGAHRFAYELSHGPIASGNDICHTCDNPLCVRPDHLWLGTREQNMEDMAHKGRGTQPNLDRTHCVHGHELTPDNVWWQKGRSKSCRTCTRASQREYVLRNPEKVKAAMRRAYQRRKAARSGDFM